MLIAPEIFWSVSVYCARFNEKKKGLNFLLLQESEGMAPTPRGRHRKMVGNTRMDAALDAMRQFGFEEQLVRETVEGLLDVYEGNQGWPFIEEASYKLLIEAILSNQRSSTEEKKKEDSLQDNARRDGDIETSSAATPTTGITEAGSSNLVAQDSSLQQNSDGLDSASQTNDQDCASLGNIEETDVKDSIVPAERGGGHGQGIRVESENGQKHVDNVTGSNYSTSVRNLGSAFVSPVIQSSQPLENLPFRKRKPCYGWIGGDDDGDLICFPLPPLPEHVEKLIGQNAAPQSGGRRTRKSRWDEKPDDM